MNPFDSYDMTYEDLMELMDHQFDDTEDGSEPWNQVKEPVVHQGAYAEYANEPDPVDSDEYFNSIPVPYVGVHVSIKEETSTSLYIELLRTHKSVWIDKSRLDSSKSYTELIYVEKWIVDKWFGGH